MPKGFPKPLVSKAAAGQVDQQRRKPFVFVVNNYKISDWEIICSDAYCKKVRYLIASQEIAPETGTPHIQGYLVLKTAMTTTALHKYLDKLGLTKRALLHANGDSMSNYTYVRKLREGDIPNDVWFEYGDRPCSKTEHGKKGLILYEQFESMVKEGKTWIELDKLAPVLMSTCQAWCKRVYENQRWECLREPQWTPHPWQAGLFSMLTSEEPMTRRIFWIWSSESLTGKSTFFSEYVAYHFKQEYMPVTGMRYADIICAYKGQRIIHINLPRSMDGDDTDKYRTVIYNMLEKLSDLGPQFSGKYESQVKLVWAHICVTANVPPDIGSLPRRFIEFHLEPYSKTVNIIDFMKDPEEKTIAIGFNN